MPHLSITGPLLELNAKLVETRTSFLHIINSESDMAEATTGISVSARVAFEFGIALSAMVVRELKHA